jgi:hypothetical protein
LGALRILFLLLAVTVPKLRDTLKMERDLFGEELPPKPLDITEQYVKDRDELFFAEKAKRLKHLHKINPGGLMMAGPIEFVLTFREVQLCFIDGHFLATIVLAQAFVEKLIHEHYKKLGLESISNKGLYAMLQHARKHKTISSFVVNHVDAIRLMRNPITHTKDINYQHGLDKRSYNNRTSPFIQLEKDAKKALEISTLLALKDLNEII